MLENLYTTKMSNDKEKLKTRLENIQRQPKKKHTALGLLVTLVLAAALTVGTLCLAANEAEDVTMTDQEFAAFLDQPWGAVMASLDYADEEILVFHYNEALCVVDLANQSTFRHILDLRDLNLTTAAQGDVFLQVDMAQDGSEAYLSVGGMTDLAAEYDTYVVDLSTGQVKKGKIPQEADLFRGYQQTTEAVPDAAGWYSVFAVTVGDQTYYLSNGGPMVRHLQLVTRWDDGRPDKVWYLFGEDLTIPDQPPSDLYTKVETYMAEEYHRVYDPYYDIQELTLSNWQQNGNEATFFYTMTYLHYNRDPSKVAYIQSVKDDPELYESRCKDYLALQTSNYAFKIIWEGDSPVLYYEVDVEGGVDYHGPITIDSFVMGSQSENTAPSEPSHAEDTVLSEPSQQQTTHFSALDFQAGNYLSGAFTRVLSPYFDITEQAMTEWTPIGEDEATFLYTITYRKYPSAEDPQNTTPATEQLTYAMKVARDENRLTFYRDIGGIGGGEYTGPEWVPTDVQSLVSLP